MLQTNKLFLIIYEFCETFTFMKYNIFVIYLGTCKIPLGKKQTRITYNGQRLTLYQVSFLLKHGYVPEETSHLCHRRYCIEETHLHDESGEINKSRNSCKKVLERMAKCWINQRSKGKRSCTLVCVHCEHEPKCFFKMGRI